MSCLTLPEPMAASSRLISVSPLLIRWLQSKRPAPCTRTSKRGAPWKLRHFWVPPLSWLWSRILRCLALKLFTPCFITSTRPIRVNRRRRTHRPRGYVGTTAAYVVRSAAAERTDEWSYAPRSCPNCFWYNDATPETRYDETTRCPSSSASGASCWPTSPRCVGGRPRRIQSSGFIR